MSSIWNKLKSALSGRTKEVAAPTNNLQAVLDLADDSFKKAGSALDHMVTCHQILGEGAPPISQNWVEGNRL